MEDWFHRMGNRRKLKNLLTYLLVALLLNLATGVSAMVNEGSVNPVAVLLPCDIFISLY